MKNGQRVIGITLLGMIILAGCMLASVAYGSNLIPIGLVLQARRAAGLRSHHHGSLLDQLLDLREQFGTHRFELRKHWAYQVLSCRL